MFPIVTFKLQPIPNTIFLTIPICRCKVFDYQMALGCQKYINATPVSHMAFTPDLRSLIIAGDDISVWSFAGRSYNKQVILYLSLEQGPF